MNTQTIQSFEAGPVPLTVSEACDRVRSLLTTAGAAGVLLSQVKAWTKVPNAEARIAELRKQGHGIASRSVKAGASDPLEDTHYALTDSKACRRQIAFPH